MVLPSILETKGMHRGSGVLGYLQLRAFRQAEQEQSRSFLPNLCCSLTIRGSDLPGHPENSYSWQQRRQQGPLLAPLL